MKRQLDLETKFTPAPSDAGVFRGYAATFGAKDSYGDIVAPGAFKASLAQHKAAGTRPLMLWQHRVDEPIGVWTGIREDMAGLMVEGSLVTDTPEGGKAYSLLKAGALNGLSIGFRTRKAKAMPGGGRLLEEIDLVEISLVSLPSNPTARVTDVRAEIPSAISAAELAAFFRACARHFGE
ncbi:Phage prohead protease (Modular protein) [uncultured Alphaproteobacteria bacterium]|uniref:Phage prohead protease (Modular protein) n=1 Tax=uncultured Alphaproteobacteria bacterium TaxID=91750 RepID=A0A212K2E4_9PROT|nr:Phage prohead protease (Modular protein) [uncultured Alphaproteobacteria bacterium]